MIRFIFTGLVSVALVVAFVSESSARGPRGGGGGSRGGIGGMSGNSRGGGGMRGNPGGGPSVGGSSAGRSPSMSGARSPGSGGFSPSGSRRNGSAGFQQGGAGPSSGARPGGTRPGEARGSQPGGPSAFPAGGSRPGGSAFERPGVSTQPAPEQRRPGSGSPTDRQLGGFLDLPGDRDIGGESPVVDRRQQQPSPPASRTPGEGTRVAERRDQVPDRRQESVDDRMEQRKILGDQVRDETPGSDQFSDQWRERHQDSANGRWRYTEKHAAVYWRRGGSWTGVTGWVAGGWAEPIYYDYGNTLTYQDGYVYQAGEQVATAEQYAQQAQQIAQAPVEETPETAEWMPLGVFAMVREKNRKPTMFLELAVSKEGTIAGTYSNTTSDSAQPVEGRVDRESQRAAWWIGSNQNNILETGIFNLTKEETPVLVHFGSQQTQTWLLVRLEDSTEVTSDAP